MDGWRSANGPNQKQNETACQLRLSRKKNNFPLGENPICEILGRLAQDRHLFGLPIGFGAPASVHPHTKKPSHHENLLIYSRVSLVNSTDMPLEEIIRLLYRFLNLAFAQHKSLPPLSHTEPKWDFEANLEKPNYCTGAQAGYEANNCVSSDMGVCYRGSSPCSSAPINNYIRTCHIG